MRNETRRGRFSGIINSFIILKISRDFIFNYTDRDFLMFL